MTADEEDLPHPASEAPLLSRTSSRASTAPSTDHPTPNSSWIWFLTLSSGISGLLFGYDTASISSALLYLGPSLSTPSHPVTTWDRSIITSSTSLGALLGGLVAGILADTKLGRRGVIFLADLLFLLGAIWQAGSTTVASMVAGRLVVGFGVGIGSLIVPLYISELSPASHRGRLVVISVLFITLGQLLAYTIGLVLSPPRLQPDLAWRLILGLGGLPAILQACLMLFMPESPRWQLLHSQRSAAAKTLSLTHPTSSRSAISRLLTEIESGLPKSSPLLLQPFVTLMRVPTHRRALTIACFLQFLQQASGFNTLMYFSATIFASIGFRTPTAVAMVVALTNAISTAVAFALIDHAGRRRMLLISLAGMILGLMSVSLGFSYSGPSNSLIIAGITLFVATYALGLGAVPWVAQSEFFAMEVRGVGTGVATATNWFTNVVIATSFLGVCESLGESRAFAIYALIVAVGLAVSWKIYPETKGLKMEEVEGVLRDGWGV